MQIVLLGLSQPRMQHLAMVLEKALAPVLPGFSLLTPNSPQGWKPPPLPYRILLFASDPSEHGTTLWRHTLIMQGLPFQVIQANGEAWVKQCLQTLLPLESVEGMGCQDVAERWQGTCESCSDPDCERRLFSGLLQGRGAGGLNV
jgi:hypothetical protein